jgi:type II restriction enzyme
MGIADFTGTSWLQDVRNCVEQIDRSEFVLDDVYKFETALLRAYPGNSHVREKIRQQLQVLRDLGELELVDDRGTYRKLD